MIKTITPALNGAYRAITKRKEVCILKRSGGSFFLVLAVLMALVAGFLVMQAVRSAAPTVPVLVARVDMQPGERLTGDKLEVVKLPEAAVPANQVTAKDLDFVLNRHLKTAVAKGVPIQTSYVAEFSPEGGTLAAQVSLAGENLRGVALPPEASTGLALEPGDRVDVIAAMKSPDGKTIQIKTILQSVPVIQVLRDRDSGEQKGVVLGLAPGEAETLVLALSAGKVQVTAVPLH